jgi:predicted MFS family arabinose efflux permease
MFFLLSLADTPLTLWAGAAVILYGALYWWEKRAQTPFLDLGLLANVPLTITYARVTVTYIAFYSVFYSIPQWLEEAGGRSAVQAGLIFLPIPLIAMVSTLVATRLQKRHGPTPTVLIGSAVLVVGGLLLTLANAGMPLILLLLILAVLGLPNGFNNMGNQSQMYQAAAADQIGAASGLYRTCQYVGANLAAALIAIVLGESASDQGLHRMGFCIAGVAGVVLISIVAGIVVPRRRGRAAI